MRTGEMTLAMASTADELTPAQAVLRDWLLCTDPPLHTAVRSALAPAFMPVRIEALRQDIRRITETLWTAWIEQPDADFVDRVAQPLPVQVIARVLGFPEEDVPLFREWNGVWRRAIDRDSEEGYAAAAPTAAAMVEYLRAHIERPPAGLARPFDYPALVDRCGRDAVVANLGLLIFAGSETTGHLLSSMMLQLGLYPDAWGRLRRREVGAAAVVNETLRCESPVQKIGFRLAAPFAYGEQRLDVGDTVVVLVGAANRDPAAYTAPDRFDVGRHGTPELAFGAGPHACLGRRLAQLEAEIFLDVATNLFDEVIVEGWHWLPETTFRALERLDLRIGRTGSPPA